MKNFDYKKVMEWLRNVLKCPICQFKYNIDQTQVIDSEQNEISGGARILIHSDCSKCKSSVMFNIEINGPEVFSVGVITDLTSKDSTKFKNSKPISPNEVIGIHKEIRNKSLKDFVKLFAQK
jgi:hypothetical protein